MCIICPAGVPTHPYPCSCRTNPIHFVYHSAQETRNYEQLWYGRMCIYVYSCVLHALLPYTRYNSYIHTCIRTFVVHLLATDCIATTDVITLLYKIVYLDNKLATATMHGCNYNVHVHVYNITILFLYCMYMYYVIVTKHF